MKSSMVLDFLAAGVLLAFFGCRPRFLLRLIGPRFILAPPAHVRLGSGGLENRRDDYGCAEHTK